MATLQYITGRERRGLPHKACCTILYTRGNISPQPHGWSNSLEHQNWLPLAGLIPNVLGISPVNKRPGWCGFVNWYGFVNSVQSYHNCYLDNNKRSYFFKMCKSKPPITNSERKSITSCPYSPWVKYKELSLLLHTLRDTVQTESRLSCVSQVIALVSAGLCINRALLWALAALEAKTRISVGQLWSDLSPCVWVTFFVTSFSSFWLVLHFLDLLKNASQSIPVLHVFLGVGHTW